MRTKSKKLLYAVISIVIAGLLTCSVLLVRHMNNSSPQTPEANLPEIDGPITDGDGNEMEPGESYPMPKAMVFRSASAQDETGLTLTATVKPDNATNQKVDWKVEFMNPSSAWATGKAVTDYVTLTPEAEGSKTATVKCVAPFGEQIKITVTSQENEEFSASCTVDYAAKLTRTNVTFAAASGLAGDTALVFDENCGPESPQLMRSFLTADDTSKKMPTFDYVLESDVYTLVDTYTTTLKIFVGGGAREMLQGFGYPDFSEKIDISNGFVPNKQFYINIFNENFMNNQGLLYNLALTCIEGTGLGNGEDNSTCLFFVEVETTGKYTNGPIKNLYNLDIEPGDVGVYVSGVELDQGTIIF